MPRKQFSTATLNTASTDATSTFDSSPSSPATFSDGLPLPRLFVFDLDYTLWPFWIDTHVSPPLRPASKDSSKPNTAMVDAYGETLTFYREVPGILYAARAKGISMGLASRTHTPDLAEIMLKNIVIPPPSFLRSSDDHSEETSTKATGTATNTKAKDGKSFVRAWDFFTYREIYPGSKTTHFQRIHQASKKKEATSQHGNQNQNQGQIAYEDMIFFDDESRNRDVEKKHGVTFVLVRDGVTREVVDRGVRDWRKRRGLDKIADGDETGKDDVGRTQSDDDDR